MGLSPFNAGLDRSAHSGGSAMKGLFNRSRSLVLFSVTGLQLMSCSPNNSIQEQTYQPEQTQIIGGSLADNNFAMRNGVVGVYNIERGATCTGSLLPNNIVLTAAHCVSNPRTTIIVFDASINKVLQLAREGKVDEARALSRPVVFSAVNSQYYTFNQRIREIIKAKIGEAETITEEQKKEIRATVAELKDNGDIALLAFQGTVPAGYQVSDLMKPSEAASISTGSRVMLAGYGFDDGVNKTGSRILRLVDDIEVSDAKYASTEVLLDQRNGRAACHGDSGGPAYSRVMVNGRPVLKLWGVTSRGHKDEKDDCSQYAIYTNAVAWHDWMMKASAALVERMKGIQTPTTPTKPNP